MTLSKNLLAILSDDDPFLQDLGRLVLEASHLEKTLRAYGDAHDMKPAGKKNTLRPLFDGIKKSKYLSPTFDEHLIFAIHQRNNFVHNLYVSLEALTGDDFTIKQFRNRVRALISDLKFFTSVLEKDLQEGRTGRANRELAAPFTNPVGVPESQNVDDDTGHNHR